MQWSLFMIMAQDGAQSSVVFGLPADDNKLIWLAKGFPQGYLVGKRFSTELESPEMLV